MGKVVDYRSEETRDLAGGVKVVPLVNWFDGVHMMASVVRLGAGARHAGKVAPGSDQYFFVLSGEARLTTPAGTIALAADDWVTLQEGQDYALEGAAEILGVSVPPPGAAAAVRPGFTGGLKRLRVGELPIVDLPKEKKQRTYLANGALATGSERGHAMIVRYTGETLTKMHHHPNAESLFVVLTGKVAFTVDGERRVLGRGEAAFFPVDDSHGLRSADGTTLSFLEFHVPGAFETHYDE